MNKTKVLTGAVLLLVVIYLLLGSSTIFSILSQVGDLYLLIPVFAVIVGLVLAYIWHRFISVKFNKSKDQQ